jgi:hypothetical protein
VASIGGGGGAGVARAGLGLRLRPGGWAAGSEKARQRISPRRSRGPLAAAHEAQRSGGPFYSVFNILWTRPTSLCIHCDEPKFSY